MEGEGDQNTFLNNLGKVRHRGAALRLEVPAIRDEEDGEEAEEPDDNDEDADHCVQVSAEYTVRLPSQAGFGDIPDQNNLAMGEILLNTT